MSTRMFGEESSGYADNTDIMIRIKRANSRKRMHLQFSLELFVSCHCYATPIIQPSTLATLRSGAVRLGARNPARLPSLSDRDSQAAIE